jgi:hypothetical protein
VNRRTRRRAVLGTLAGAAVAGTGYVLNRGPTKARWLGPAESLSDSADFAHVGGLRPRSESTMDVEIALRHGRDEGRSIVLFADSENPIDRYLPPLRSFWRLNVDVGGRDLGTHRVRVGDLELAVDLTEEVPREYAEAGLQLTPRSAWRADHIAYAHGYETANGSGRLRVRFRESSDRTPHLDSLVFRTPDGDTVGRTDVPDGVWTTTFDLEPFREFDGEATLVGFRDGEQIDEVKLFYS